MSRLFTFFFLLFSVSLFAQPANDDCSGIIDLGVAPFCPDTVFFTNLNATATDIGNDNIPGPGACSGNDITFVGNDVWFQFTASDTITDYTITLTGMSDGMGSDPMSNPQIMIYRGDCGFDELALLACGASDDGESVLELDVLDLDPNETYFIRINDFSTTGTPNWGSFLLCIDEIDPINTIDQDGSNACTGELYDTGGPDGDYSGSENNTFSICPPFGQNACVTFTLQYYNFELGNDNLTFYDGPDTNSPQITTITGDDFGNPNNVGGVCFVVQASSGCLTVEFTSDGSVEFEGFAGTWECSALPCEPTETITVNDNITDQDIIDNVSTPQTTVTVDTIICPPGAYGTFAAPDNSDLGLEQGLLLTSGSVVNALGPNTFGGAGTLHFSPGDPDLDFLSTQSGGQLSQDACVVEVDVFVATDELVFEYIFGSEEYPEYVNDFNDIFALLISGPGITGDPGLNNQENIAVLPNTTTPVEINSVNDVINWEYYRNNQNGLSVEYDGLTSDFLGVKKSLTARRSVTPCNTYHLKFAIADRGDSAFDSGVFVSEIKGGTPSLTINFASGVDYLIEDCTGMDDELLITLSNPLPDSVTYDVVISGTATPGVDYILDIPSQVTIPAGQTQLGFPIIPLSDGLIEGTETITIALTSNFGCGDIQLNEITVEITDAPVVDIFSGVDTAFVCLNECITMEVEGAVDYFWEPVSVVDDAFATNPEACPTTSQFLFVTGSIGALPGCSDTDTIWLEVVDPQMDIVALADTMICNGESVQLQAVNNVGNTNLEWTPADGLDATDQEIVTAEPGVGVITYTASVNVQGCVASDDITVTVDAFDFPTLTTTDTTICQGQSVTLANNIPITTTTYEWTPDDALNPGNDVSGPTATPESNTTYTIIATSESGSCSDTAQINIEVIPAEVSIMPEDTVFICLGETAVLTATTTTNMVEWTPTEGLSDSTSLSVTVDITESDWYFATMSIGACTVTDSVFVRVDSLPNIPIQAIPDTGPYCPGEIVTLVSPTFEPNDYPDIEHFWSPGTGVESDLSNLNLVISTVETTTYIRSTTNNACSQTDSITIEVVDISDLEIAWTDTTICAGDPLMNQILNGDNPEWSPGTALSCTECYDPTITALDTIVYTVEIDIEGCPVTETVTVNVVPDPTGSVISDSDICIGDEIMLNTTTDFTPGTVYIWTANPPDPSLDPNASQPMVSPMQTTTYTVTIQNNFCDPYTDEVTINVLVDPIVTVDPLTLLICEGESITLTATSSEEGGVFTWSGTAAVEGMTGNTITDSPSDTAVYTVTYTTPCDTIINTIDVFVQETVSVSEILIEPDTTPYLEGQIVDLTAIPEFDIPGLTYLWDDGQTGQTVSYQILSVPTDTIGVTISTANGCTESLEIVVDVIEADPETPNIFTPNGDGENDTFNFVSFIELEVLEFKVYSRWGTIVYDNDDPANGWDGTYNDEDLPSDVYMFVIKYRTPSGKEEILKGDVTLMR